MKISRQGVLQRGECVNMVVHSLSQALYQVTVAIEGGEYLLTENDGKPLRRYSLMAMREALQDLPVGSLSLRQRSAYDEMIGQPGGGHDNTLEVNLALELYPAPAAQR